MTIAMQPIYTQTVGAGGVLMVTFNNIPQTYTDLKIVISSRSTLTSSMDTLGIYFNGSQANISNTFVTGNGSSTTSNRTTYRGVGVNNSNFAIANTFANTEIYIPNYTSSNFKQMLIDSVSENNVSITNQSLCANLWSQTTAITSLSFDNATSGQNFVQYSTFSLYGITKG